MHKANEVGAGHSKEYVLTIMLTFGNSYFVTWIKEQSITLFNYYTLHIVLRGIEWHHSVEITQTRPDVSEADPQRIKGNKIRGIKVDIRTRDEQMERIPAKPSAPSKTLQGTNALVYSTQQM